MEGRESAIEVIVDPEDAVQGQKLVVCGLDITGWPPLRQLLFLSCSILVIYCGYSFLQEGLIASGFRFGLFLTWAQFLMFASLSFFEQVRDGRLTKISAPLPSYGLIALLAVTSMGLSNTSLTYLNYPTQVVFKSSKVIPVMIGSLIVLGKRYTLFEYLSALCLVSGISAFALIDSTVRPSFNLTGIVLVCGSVGADGFMSNLQEKVLRTHGGPLTEMIFFVHSLGAALLLVAQLATGELTAALNFLAEHPSLKLHLVVFAVFSYVGCRFVMLLLQRFGAVVCVTLTSIRKLSTIILSFLFFPKPFSIWYVLAGALVAAAFALNALSQKMKVKASKLKVSHALDPPATDSSGPPQ